MGGKTSTSTQAVTIPQDVLNRYNSVNASAQQTASTPFQQYSTNPSAFVAPINETQQAGINQTGQYAQAAQPYFDAATGQLVQAQGQTAPYYGAATSDVGAAQGVGSGLAGASLGSLAGANASAGPLQGLAGANYTSAYQGAQPYNAGALASYTGGLSAAQPLQSEAASNIAGAQGIGQGLGAASLGSITNAGAASTPIQYGALGQIQNSAAAAQPYSAGATGAALAGAGAVNPSNLDAASIQKYLSPYLQTVLGSTANVLNQNNQQQQGGQLGNAITSGAFGGDRAGIAAANLEEQQNLANANIYSGILNSGYSNALGTAQQQQGVGLGAAQANRAAIQGLAPELQSIGNQNFTQGQTAATNASQVGSTLFGQGATTAAQEAALGQNLSGLSLAAAGQQAGLGQQQFQQGQTLGSNLQGLGSSIYGQGMGLGMAQQGLASQEFGQGATMAAQEAALGEQQFGQGITASGQTAALGQDIYGTGAATSAGLASLGQGAQGAGLAGAQAQQAAGATQQQTTQAGDTALYNQFLQQQSYPFQVDQFLANIAEGTGSLSGSTTTTTQPQSIFSDERLKEGIEPVGKTFDGQNIVKFRYKGDPTTHMGLIAQDVEKKHPEAVGLAAGYRTVDYDKATEGAAERGHFKAGGLAAANDNRGHFAAGGYGSEYAPAYGTYGYPAWQSSGEGYGPYATGGLYGGAPNGVPHGGQSYVPQTTVPVGRLAVAGGLPAQQSMASQADQAASVISRVNSGIQGKDGQALLRQLGIIKSPVAPSVQTNTADTYVPPSDLPDPTSTDASDTLPLRRGGLARAAFADGGTPDPNEPYGLAGPGLDIPDDTPKSDTLSLPGALPKQQSGGLGSILGDIGTVASIFLPKAAGGAVDTDPADTDERRTMQSLLSGNVGGGLATQPAPVEAAPGASDGPPAAPMAGGLSGASIVSPQPNAPSQAAPSTAGASLPSNLSNTLAGIFKSEGTGKNPMSSARGPYQIIDPTFVGLFRQMFPDRAADMSKAQILAIRQTPEGNQLSSQMGPVLASNNIKALQGAGIDPSAPNVYLAHFLGPNTAIHVLNADPSTPMTQLVSPLAIQENKPILAGKTAADVIAWTARRMQQSQPRAAGGRAGYADGGGPTIAPNDPTDVPAINDPATMALQSDNPGAPVSGPDDAPLMPHAVPHDPAPTPAKSSWTDDLRKPEVFIPILTGLAAAAATPTVHPLMAIAEGLGAGAQSYQQQREYALQQQQVAQHGQEVGVYQGELALKPQELANQREQAHAAAVQAQTQAASLAMQLFNAGYVPLTGKVGPDGNPMYLEQSTGRQLTYAQYSSARDRYMDSMLSRFGGSGAGPLGAAGALTGDGGNGVPNGPGAGVPNGGGGVLSTSGLGIAGSGSVPPIGQPDNAGAGNVGSPQPNPVVHAPPVQHVAPPSPSGSSLKEKLASGAYLKPTISMPTVDNSQLPNQYNPDWLMKTGQSLIANGVTDDQRHQGQTYLDTANGIRNGTIIPQDNNGQPYMGYAQLAQANTAAASTMQSFAAQKTAKNEAADEFASQLPAAAQLQNSLIRVYQNWDTNRLSESFADLIGKVQSVPGLADALSPQIKEYQSATDEAHKQTARQAIVSAVAANMASHAPAAALRQANMTVPNPTMAPGARYDLAVQQAALLKAEQDYYRTWNQNKGQVNDVSSYDTDYWNEHPVSKYEQWGYDNIAPFAGMTPQEMAAHPRHPQSPADLQGLRSGTPFIIPSGPRKGQMGYTP